MKYKMLATFMVVLGFFILAGNALASGKTAAASATASTSGDLYRFIPKGVDPFSDTHATQQVITYAKQNPAYGQALASQTGDAGFVPSAYKADGYRPKAPAGSTNSAAGTGGQVVATADHGNSASVKVVAIINLHTMQVAYVMVRCGNLRLMRVTPIPWKPIQVGVSVKINRVVTKSATITCPSGQKVSGFVSTRVKGVIYAKTHGQVKGWAKIWLRQQADLQIKTVLTLKCGPAPTPPPPPPTPTPVPTATFSATATATATAYAVCPDGTTATASGSGSGSATSTVSQADADQRAHAQAQASAQANATALVKCGTPPPPAASLPSVSITSVIDLNDVPEGKNSGQLPITLNASAAGSMTIDPGNGGISACDSSTPLSSITLSFSAGNSTLCVIYYAPLDSTATTGSITYTAIVNTSGGTAKDVKTDTFNITHPVRPA